MTQVVEGLWEELLTRDEELRGHRVRVTLLDVTPESSVPALARAVELMKQAQGHSGGRKWKREDLYSE